MAAADRAAEEDLAKRIRETVLATAEARRLELGVYERLINKLNMDVTENISSAEYHLPRTLKLMDAKDASERAQESGVRRNWPILKVEFDRHGGVLSISQLREALARCGLTAPHAGRVVLRAAALLLPGDDLLSYDEMFQYYFHDQANGYETDSDAEAEILEATQEDVAEPVQAGLTKPEKLATSDDDDDDTCLYARRIKRLRRKIKAAVQSKGVPVMSMGTLSPSQRRSSAADSCFGGSREKSTCFGEADIESILDLVGYSIKFLRQIDKEWLAGKPYRKSSVVLTQGSREELPSLIQQPQEKLVFHPNWLPGQTSARSLGSQDSLAGAVAVVRIRAVNAMNALARGALVRSRARYIYEETIIAKAYHLRVIRLIRKWFAWNRTLQFMNKNVRKVFCRWRSRVRRLHKEREFFRLTFWPFYVWRRFARQQAVAKDKARFLKRVWNTLVTLRHFRAWSRQLRNSKLLASQAMLQLLGRQGREAERHFLAWRQHTIQATRIRNAWQQRGTKLRETVLRDRTRRYWCVWKLFARATRRSRRTILRYYNVVPGPFAKKQQYYRTQLHLSERAYVSEEQMPVPLWPSLSLFLGLEDVDFVKKRPLLCAALEKFHSEVKERTRLGRITLCIERNRLGGDVFKNWREVVEAGQKDRFAWHFYITRLQRIAFRAWDSVTSHKARPKRGLKSRGGDRLLQRDARDSVDLAGGIGVGADGQDDAANTMRHRKTLFVAGMTVSDESADAQSRVDALTQRRESLRKLQRERFERSSQFLGDPNYRKQSLRNATAAASKVRRERLSRMVKLQEHDERLRLAQENLEISESSAAELLEERRLQLEEKKRLQMEHAQRLRAMRARMMHNALYSVFEQLERDRMDTVMRTCFRMLRFPVIARKSFGLMQHKRLENWLRICARFRKLYRSMPRYYRLRLKLVTFNKWLHFLDARIRTETPGLREEINSRRQRLTMLSSYLRERGEKIISIPEDAKVWFLRWVEFAQRAHARRRIEQLLRERARLGVLQRVLAGWRLGIKTMHSASLRQVPGSEVFATARCIADLDKWKCRFISLERRMLSSQLRRRNRFVASSVRYSVLGPERQMATLLKRVLDKHITLTHRRLDLEMRLLCSAFNERGTYTYSDKRTRCVGLPLDKASGARHYSDVLMETSVNVHGVIVAVTEGMVVGLQLRFRSGPVGAARVWQGPVHGFTRAQSAGGPLPGGAGTGELDMDEGEMLSSGAGGRAGVGAKPSAGSGPNGKGPSHGFGHAQGLKTFEFQMQDPHERITQVEGFAMHNMVAGKLRFRTSNGRVSPWYGSCENGKRFSIPEAPEMTSFGKRRFEEEFIVGFYGACTNNAILTLGVLLRQVEKKNVFSRCWLDRVDSLMDMDDGSGEMDEVNIEEQQAFIDQLKLAHQQQFNSVLAMRRADVETALERSAQLARRMRYGAVVPRALTKVRVIAGVMRWLFNALSRKLVKFDARMHRVAMVSMQDGALSRGYMMIQQGNTRLRNAKKQLRRLEGLAFRSQRGCLASSTAAATLTEAEIGEKRFLELQAAMEHQRCELADAETLIMQGRASVDHGLHNMPKLDTSLRTLAYYEHLVHLAQIKDQIGA
ncbi:Hypothetical Protein FCC1311_040362 [Hondaea fermentalgiana]|uniref:Uncharacterized protein n=1 Tax=Hondaea fermentalgiana TaxID=2315210 RepID=A0A2R5GGN2_9STRA|nr:Hypothetical Protein FCC1311_040362 [Hondaea fermentalgiana]|eukprot:GBG27813.1 Hypothetical Protein FCC1311_040362 [Hondaea fermentalgiana]